MVNKQSPKTRDEKIDAFIVDWKNNYVRWAIIFFLGLSIYRTTTDGLWFMAFVVISFAYNLESHVKYGTPFIRGRKKNQSIKDYGIGRAISTIILPKIGEDLSLEIRKRAVMPPDMMYVFLGRAINTVLLLHFYVLFIILFDIFDRELLRSLLGQFNQPFQFILDNWNGLRRASSSLRSHYYSGFVPVLEHIYIVTVFFCTAYLFGIIGYVLKPAFFKGYLKHFANIKEKYTKKKIKSLGADFSTSSVGRLIYGVIMFCLFMFFVNIFSPFLYFDGERTTRHGKYIWMASYMYKDYLGYFTPTYMLSIFLCGFVHGFVPLLEIPCRISIYIGKIFKTKLIKKI